VGLGGRFVGNGLGGEKICHETGGVGIEELLDTIGVRRFEDESGMVIFRNTVDDFGVIVHGGVRVFLAS
jgi:hypothetical protein